MDQKVRFKEVESFQIVIHNKQYSGSLIYDIFYRPASLIETSCKFANCDV